MTYPNAPGAVKVRCRGIGALLIKDIVPGYSCDLGDEKTPTDILTELLAYQDDPKVTLGGVDPGLDSIVAFSIDYMSIWGACLELQKVVGGRLYVDVDPDDATSIRLWLKETMTTADIKQIRLGKNMVGVHHLKDYSDYANRLYPVGNNDLALSTKTYTDVDAAPSSDDDYGYLFLNELYGAYDGWTGAGNALPGSITIKKPTGAWEDEIGYTTVNRSSGSWYGNYTFYNHQLHTWTDYLIMEFTPRTTTQIKFFRMGGGYGYGTLIQVDISANGTDWTNVYYLNTLAGWDWYTCTFASQSVKYIRYTCYRNVPDFGWAWCDADAQLWNPTGLADDTSKWEQGANERTVRCDIGDFVEDVGYVISYTHADYLIDLESPTMRPGIHSAFENFSTADVDELRARASVKLADLKTPLVSVSIDMVDLSIGEDEEDEYEIGDRLDIIDEGLEISEQASIVSYGRPDLYQPGNIKLEISTKRKDIIDVI